MDKHTKNMIFNFVFNIAETLVIVLMGVQFEIPVNTLLILLLTFFISRACFGHPLHYKTWYRCLIFSALLMLTLFVLLKVELILSFLFAVFNALIMTGRSNIQDMYLWNNNNEPSKYQDVMEYIKYNEFDDTLLEFENKLKDKSPEYLIYKYRFKEGKTFADISELLDMDTPRIVEYLDKIAFAIRIYCKI